MSGRKLLYVAHRSWPYLGGGERLFWEWAVRSAASGDEVSLFTTDAWDIEYLHDPTRRRVEVLEEVVQGVRLRRFRVYHPPPRLKRRLFGAGRRLPGKYYRHAFGYPEVSLPGFALWTLFARERFDIVTAGVFPHLFLLAPAAAYARRTGAKLVAVPLTHLGEPNPPSGHDPRFLSPFHADLLKGADAVVTMTGIERDALAATGVPAAKTHVVGAGVTPSELEGGVGARFRQRYGIRGRIVLQVSSQTHDKGSHHLFEAMKPLWGSGSDVTLVMIGQSLSDFDTYFLQQPPHLFERALVLDYVDDQTKRDALDACDVLAMPSRADSFGIVFLEAWLYGKPVIGAFAGGVPELVTDGQDGLLVPFGDIHMLSESLRVVLDAPPLARALGQNGRRKALDRYTWEKSFARLSTVYGEVDPR